MHFLSIHADAKLRPALTAIIIQLFVTLTGLVWNLTSGEEIHTLFGHLEIVNSVAIDDDGRILISSDFAGNIKVWDLGTGQEIYTVAESENNSRESTFVSISSDGQTLAYGSSTAIKVLKYI